MLKRLHNSAFLIAVFSLQATLALAAEGHEGGEHKSGGLPQLDPSSFPSQIFWLLLVFGFLYLFFSQKSLPDIARVIENRNDSIQNDLDTAQNLKDEVASVKTLYEANLSKSHHEATDMFKKIEADMKAKSESEVKAFAEKSSGRVSDLEKNIARARDQAMKDMSIIASEIAIAASEKIIGVRPEAHEARQVVENLHKTSKPAKAA